MGLTVLPPFSRQQGLEMKKWAEAIGPDRGPLGYRKTLILFIEAHEDPKGENNVDTEEVILALVKESAFVSY